MARVASTASHVSGHCSASDTRLFPESSAFTRISRWHNKEKKQNTQKEAQGGVDIIGIAKLTPHGARPWTGPLCPPTSREGEFLEQIYHRPADGCIIKVVEAAALTVPIRVNHLRTATTALTVKDGR